MEVTNERDCEWRMSDFEFEEVAQWASLRSERRGRKTGDGRPKTGDNDDVNLRRQVHRLLPYDRISMRLTAAHYKLFTADCSLFIVIPASTVGLLPVSISSAIREKIDVSAGVFRARQRCAPTTRQVHHYPVLLHSHTVDHFQTLLHNLANSSGKSGLTQYTAQSPHCNFTMFGNDHHACTFSGCLHKLYMTSLLDHLNKACSFYFSFDLMIGERFKQHELRSQRCEAYILQSTEVPQNIVPAPLSDW